MFMKKLSLLYVCIIRRLFAGKPGSLLTALQVVLNFRLKVLKGYRKAFSSFQAAAMQSDKKPVPLLFNQYRASRVTSDGATGALRYPLVFKTSSQLDNPVIPGDVMTV